MKPVFAKVFSYCPQCCASATATRHAAARAQSDHTSPGTSRTADPETLRDGRGSEGPGSPAAIRSTAPDAQRKSCGGTAAMTHAHFGRDVAEIVETTIRLLLADRIRSRPDGAIATRHRGKFPEKNYGFSGGFRPALRQKTASDLTRSSSQ
jgi:hypothetical protein